MGAAYTLEVAAKITTNRLKMGESICVRDTRPVFCHNVIDRIIPSSVPCSRAARQTHRDTLPVEIIPPLQKKGGVGHPVLYDLWDRRPKQWV